MSFLAKCWYNSKQNVVLEFQVRKEAWFIKLEFIYHTLNATIKKAVLG